MLDRVIVDQVAGLKVVSAVEDDLHSLKQRFNICGNQILDLWIDDNLRIKRGNLAGGGNCFGQGLGGVLLIEQRLPLQVAGLDVIAIDNSQSSQACTRQQSGQRGAGRATADDGHSCRCKPALSFDSDAAE